MKCPYHLVQAGQVGCRQIAHTFDSPRATSAPQHAHRTRSAEAGREELSQLVLAFEVIVHLITAWMGPRRRRGYSPGGPPASVGVVRGPSRSRGLGFRPRPPGADGW